jgi:hypothetical protein
MSINEGPDQEALFYMEGLERRTLMSKQRREKGASFCSADGPGKGSLLFVSSF